MKRVLSFFGRRITPREYLGLHLTLGMIISLFALAIFVLIAREVVGERDLTSFDRKVAQRLIDHSSAHPALLDFFRFVTHFGDVPAITTLTVVGGLLLAVQRHRLLTLVWFAAAMGGGLLILTLKEGFERQRPPLEWRDPMATERNESFPSGHSMGSVIGYGMLGYVMVLRLRRRRARLAVCGGLILLVLLIGCSRVYLRAHWFSDVCAGFAIGTMWLTVCVSGLEVVRRRRHARRVARAAAHRHARLQDLSSEHEKADRTGSI
jgi:undecaprenyl-diphosphatase